MVLPKLCLEALQDEKKGVRDFYGDWFKVLDFSGIHDEGIKFLITEDLV